MLTTEDNISTGSKSPKGVRLAMHQPARSISEVLAVKVTVVPRVRPPQVSQDGKKCPGSHRSLCRAEGLEDEGAQGKLKT